MPSTSPSAERLLHCSAARTVVVRTDAASGTPVVVKVFVAGSMADAEREFAMATLAAGPGVVEPLRVGIDPATNRPCVTNALVDGRDLEALVAERGALPAAEACALLAPVAETLARLHGLRAPAAAGGLCHGDVKPRNLLRTATTTLLLDFEHAHPIAGGTTAPVALGTPGFVAPEAARRGVPSPAIDVFACGRTLAWLLAGGDAPGLPQDERVERLLAACTHEDPQQRPTAAALASTLRELAAALAADADEARLHDAATGALQLPVPAANDGSRVARWWRARHRLLARRPGLLKMTRAMPAEVGPLLAEFTRVQRLLAWFPRHADCLQHRRDLQRSVSQQFAGAAAHVAASCRAEAFAAAAEWVRGFAMVVQRTAGLPGGLPLPDHEDPPAARTRHHDPAAFLQRLAHQIEHATAELQADTDRIAEAEQRLDLRAAEAAVDALAARRGGASPSVARQRDRVHRLAFYLDRIARAEANVERIAPLWDVTALLPLREFVAAATRARDRGARSDQASGAVGLRSLQLTLANLAEENTHVVAVPPALEALTLLLQHVTDQAWQLLDEARAGLAAVPVPVRPLQLTLGRLDTFRVLEAFVDRPERPRSQLLDDIEALRLQLEQARATRDRLAESAEHALARGHWTTGLFDMERAVAGISPADAQEAAEATRLQERLEQARRRKQEIEGAVRRNVELATSYGMLQDEASSTFGQRLQVLEERRDCLLFLTMHVPTERSVLYARDLREVDTQIVLERAGLAEHQLDGTVDAAQRLALARATREQLDEFAAQREHDHDVPGRVLRVLEHWRTVAEHCQRAVDDDRAAAAHRTRQRTRLLALAIVVVVATTTAAVLAVRPWLFGEPARAAGR